MYSLTAVIETVMRVVVDYTVLSTNCHYSKPGESSARRTTTSMLATSTQWRWWLPSHFCIVAFPFPTTLDWLAMGAPRHTESDIVEFETCVENVEILEVDCMNHAHKRMGTALLMFTTTQEPGGHGHRRLPKDKAMILQHYYRYGDDRRDIDSMWNRILFHCMSTDDESHHTHCPRLLVFPPKALVRDEEPPSHLEHVKPALDHDVKPALDHDVKPALDHDVKPALDHDVKPALDHDVKPALDHDVKPALDHDVKPALDHDVKPALDHDVKPALDHDVKPALDHDVKPALDHDVKPALDHDVTEAMVLVDNHMSE